MVTVLSVYIQLTMATSCESGAAACDETRRRNLLAFTKEKKDTTSRVKDDIHHKTYIKQKPQTHFISDVERKLKMRRMIDLMKDWP